MRWPTDKSAIHKKYDDDGFVIVRRVYNPQQVNELRANLQRYIDDIVPQLPPMDGFFEDAGTRRQIRMLPRMETHDAYFRELLTRGPIRSIAESLSRCDVVPHDAAYFNKLPMIGDETPPHQDGFYFHLEPCEALTLWLALDDVNEQNGCIRYVRGSHRRGMREHGRTRVLGFSQGIVDYGTEDDTSNELAACVAPGDVIAHHAMTIHRADANPSPDPRRALGFIYFSAAATVDQAISSAYQRQLADEWKAEGKI